MTSPVARARPRVLCVDDEPNVLESLLRTLRKEFDVTTALGPEAGLTALGDPRAFAVVLSDLRMPEMDGVAFLTRARALAPDAVRVLLTGQGDLASAMAAVNEGSVFRFLAKPCPPDTLREALWVAAEQHRLITAERTLLEETLRGSIKALTDILALMNPAAFGRAMRAKSLVAEFVSTLSVENGWEVEIAAMLSQIGSVALPAPMVEKLYRGEDLSYAESLTVDRLPTISRDLIAGIPRLEGVREALAFQNHRFEATGAESARGTGIPWGARLLRLVLDFDVLETQGVPAHVAVETLRSRTGWYDPELLHHLAELRGGEGGGKEEIEVDLRALRPGMVLAADVRTTTGTLLIARGQEISGAIVDRVRSFAHLPVAHRSVRVNVSSIQERAERPSTSGDEALPRNPTLR